MVNIPRSQLFSQLFFATMPFKWLGKYTSLIAVVKIDESIGPLFQKHLLSQTNNTNFKCSSSVCLSVTVRERRMYTDLFFNEISINAVVRCGVDNISLLFSIKCDFSATTVGSYMQVRSAHHSHFPLEGYGGYSFSVLFFLLWVWNLRLPMEFSVSPMPQLILWRIYFYFLSAPV